MANPSPEQKNKTGGILLLVFLSFFCLLIFAVFLNINSQPSVKLDHNNNQPNISQSSTSSQEARLKQTIIEGENQNWFGTSSPIVTIVQFADFACLYCQSNFPILREIGATYGDQIKIIYRNYLAREESLTLALAAKCAGEQEKFWPMHDKLFQNQGVKTAEELIALAGQTGIKQEQFANCLTAKKYLPQLQKDADDAETLGIIGTPTWFFNGKMVQGEIPRADFIRLINELLKK